jgi:cytoskeletal protein RodZ
VKCSKCGNEYDDVFNFCPECAEPKPVETQQETPPPDVPEPKKKLNLPKSKSLVLSIVALSLIVILLATTVLFVVLYTSANSDRNKANQELESIASETTEGFTPSKYVWENDTSGDGMTFGTDGTYSEIQNGAVHLSGTYEVTGDTVNMTYDMAGTLVNFSYKIDGNKLVDTTYGKNLVKE